MYTIKKNLKPIIIISVAVIAFISIILIDKLTTKTHYLTCTYEISTYGEKMVFKFYEKILVEYNRDEFAATNASNADDLYKRYMDKMETAETDEYFRYTVNKVDGGIEAHTYIYLPVHSDVFNTYFPEEDEIDRTSNIDKIKEVFEKKNYRCKKS